MFALMTCSLFFEGLCLESPAQIQGKHFEHSICHIFHQIICRNVMRDSFNDFLHTSQVGSITKPYGLCQSRSRSSGQTIGKPFKHSGGRFFLFSCHKTLSKC